MWWSNPDIFYRLIQNKHCQITRIHPTSTNFWKSKSNKAPFFPPNFPFYSLCGSVLARPLSWNSVWAQSLFCGEATRCWWERTGFFFLLVSGPFHQSSLPSAVGCVSSTFSRSTLVNRQQHRALFCLSPTHRKKLCWFRFGKVPCFVWRDGQQFCGFFFYMFTFVVSFLFTVCRHELATQTDRIGIFTFVQGRHLVFSISGSVEA